MSNRFRMASVAYWQHVQEGVFTFCFMSTKQIKRSFYQRREYNLNPLPPYQSGLLCHSRLLLRAIQIEHTVLICTGTKQFRKKVSWPA